MSLFELGGIEVVLKRQFTVRFLHARYELTNATQSSNILVSRGSAPFGQHQGSQSLGWSPRFTVFRQVWLTKNTRWKLCACSENRVRLQDVILGADQMESGLWSREGFSKCFWRRQKGKNEIGASGAYLNWISNLHGQQTDNQFWNSRLICSLKVHIQLLKVSCAAWAEMKTSSALHC